MATVNSYYYSTNIYIKTRRDLPSTTERYIWHWWLRWSSGRQRIFSEQRDKMETVLAVFRRYKYCGWDQHRVNVNNVGDNLVRVWFYENYCRIDEPGCVMLHL